MSYQPVGIGSVANDNTGDPLRTAFSKINANFVEQYALNDRGVKQINKTAHGFVVGRVLTLDGSGNYVAVNDPNTQAPVGIVSTVIDANNFVITQTGYIDTLSGLTPGATYYCQSTGFLTTVTSSIRYLLATSATSGYILLNSKNPNLTLSQVLGIGNDAGALKIINLADPTSAQDAATRGWVLSQITTPTLASVLGADNSAGGLKIANLGTPTLSTDAATKGYVDSVSIINPNLSTVLGVGNDAGARKIINLLDPTNPQDAATRGWVLSQVVVPTLQAVLVAGNDAGAQRIVNVADPVNPQDVVTKNYVITSGFSILPAATYTITGGATDWTLKAGALTTKVVLSSNDGLSGLGLVGNIVSAVSQTGSNFSQFQMSAGNVTLAASGLSGTDTLIIGGFNRTQLNLGGDGTGDVYYRNSSGYLTRLAATTDGFVLTLAGGVPTWAGGSGGSWLLASGGTLSGANTIIGTTTNLITFQFNALGVTQVNGAGLLFQNTTAATSGNQQMSPSVTFEGRGFETTGSTSQPVAFTMYSLPVQGTTVNVNWQLDFSKNGGAYTNALRFESASESLVMGSATIGRILFGTVGVGIGRENGHLLLYNGGSTANPTERMRIAVTTGNVLIGTTVQAGRLYVVQANLSATWMPVFRIDPGAHTAMTAATEFVSADFRGATQTWVAGTVATQRFNYFRSYTVAGATATANFTSAYTVYIDPPVVGTNAAISNNFALGVNGRSNFANLITVAGGVTLSSGNLTTQNSSTSLTQLGLSSLWQPALKVIPGAHTAMTAATEFISVDYQGATQTWLAGTVTTQRFNYFRGYTVAGASATNTITDAYTVYIDPSTVGTNAAITNNYALGVNGAAVVLGQLITTSTSTLAALRITGISGNPSSTVQGDIWYETGTSVLRFKGSSNNIVNVMGASANSPVGSIPFAATVTNQYSFATGFTFATTLFSVPTSTNITQPALSSAWLPVLVTAPGAHTSMTAATEFVSNDFNSATQTWLAGTTSVQRFNFFRGFTLAGATATATFTKVFTVYVAGSSAGTNASITNNFAFGAGDSASTNGYYVSADGFRSGPISDNNTTSGTSTIMWSIGYFRRLAVDQNTGGLTSGVTFQVNPLAYTGQTVERIDNFFNGARTVTFNVNGTIATQRFNYFAAPSSIVGSVATTTFTNIYNVFIDALPAAGTNVAYTNSYALGVGGPMLIGASSGTTGSVLLELNSTSRALLLSRVTNIASVTTPVDGMVAYDATTNLVNFRQNGTWTTLSAGTALQTCDVTMTTSQVNSAFTTPVQLVAAQGAGKVVYIVSAPILKYTFVTTAFTTTGNFALAAGSSVITNQMAGSLLGNTSNQYANFGMVQWSGAATAYENQAINFLWVTANSSGGGTSTVRITFQYIVVTL